MSQRALSQISGESSSRDCDPLLTAGPAGRNPCGEAAKSAPQIEISEATPPPLLADDPQARPVDFHYVPALNGGDPIIVPQPFHMRYLYGAATSQGFDSAAAGPFRNLPTFESVYDGYLATSMQWRKAYLLLQHDSTMTHYTSPEIQGNVFHRTALLATGDFNRFVSWDFEARNTFGDDALRLVNPLPSRMVGQFATAEPASATYGIHRGTVWGADLVGALTWRPDLEHTFKFYARDAYHRLFSDDSHDDIGMVKLEYQKAISERTSYGFYGQTVRQTGQIVCTTEGGGVEFITKPKSNTVLEVAAG
ncbi:MAG TPA: hypothetical protein VFA71_12250, partial [Terriglobales bacterium]|nr:hypothetical protein [Terriglobales bacterium]